MRSAVQDQARSVVRVLDDAGEVVGAGFLIGPDLVATCAHVVATALAADAYADSPPEAPVHVDFPLVRADGTEPTAARVHRWSPIGPDGTGDIAVLRLTGPVPGGARMPPLRRVDELWGHGFRVLGFPEGLADGVWATGGIRGEQGTRWFQLQSAPGDQAIVPGFSGSPVWDEASGAVVGMTVATDRSAATTTAYLLPIDQVLGLDPELLPCPYRGLEPFDEEHAEFFFGRDPDLGRLVAAVAGQPLVAVAGPSGVGKSSLVRAGLLPRQRDEGALIAELRASAATAPAAALAATLVPALQPELGPQELASAMADAATYLGSPDAAVRAATATALAAGAPEQGVLLFVDQFEELAATEPAAARELLLLVVDLVDSRRVRAVLTVRWESLTELMTPAAPAPPDGAPATPIDTVLEAGSALVAGTVLVGPMDRGRLRDAVVGPAERAPGLSFEAGLVDRILDDAGAEPGQLPLVESLLTELWERRSGGYLTIAAYEAAGGVAGAVAKRAEELLAEFRDPAEDPTERDHLRRLLTLLAQPDRDGRFVRRPVPLAELGGELRALVPRLVAGRLLVVQRPATGGETVELAHQALIEHWPRLRGWLTEDRDFLAWRAQLDQQRERWAGAGEDQGALLRGTALAAAQQWLPARAAEVSPAAREYVRRSRVRQRRDVRRWRTVTAVLAVLVLAAGTLAVVALERGNRLDAQLQAAVADNLGRAAADRMRSDPELASRLALAAWRSDPTNRQARTALAVQYLATQSVTAVRANLTDQPIGNIALSDDGQVLVLAGDRGEFVVVLGSNGPDPQRWVVPDMTTASAARLAPDGAHLLTVTAGQRARLWDLRTRTATELPFTLTADVALGSFGPDSRRIAWVSGPGRAGRDVAVWDLRTGTPLPDALPPITDADVSGVALTADPDVVLLAFGEPAEGPVRLVARSLSTGAELRTFPTGSLTAHDGALVVSCQDGVGADASATLVVVAPESGAEVRRVALSGRACSDVQVTEDGEHVIDKRVQPAGTDAVAMRLVRLADGAGYDVFLPPPAETVSSTFQFRHSTTIAATSAPGGAELLQAGGRSVIELSATPEPVWGRGQPLRQELTGGGATILAFDGDLYATYDRTTGRELAGLDTSGVPNASSNATSSVVGDRLSVQSPTPSGWQARDYALPGFEPLVTYPLPTSPDGPRGADSVVVGERFYALSDGVMSVWDATTGAMVAGPVPLAAPVDRTAQDVPAMMRPRPGHPGQLAVLGADRDVQLWDVEAGRLLDVLHPGDRGGGLGTFSFAFDRDGSRLATLGSGGVVEVWDVDRHEPVHPPVPVPSLAFLIGFDADGYVLTGSETPTAGRQVTFWDPATGQEAGSLRLPLQATGALSDDARALALDGLAGTPPGTLATTAQQWYARLCAFSDRPFTGGEVGALPPGVDTGSPCS